MAVSTLTVLRGIRTFALADATVAANLTGGIIIGEGANSAENPYAVLTFIDATPYRTFSRDGFTYRVQVAVYAGRDAGIVSASDRMAELRDRLSRSRPTISGLEVLGLDYDVQRGPFREADRWRVDQDFILTAQET